MMDHLYSYKIKDIDLELYKFCDHSLKVKGNMNRNHKWLINNKNDQFDTSLLSCIFWNKVLGHIIYNLYYLKINLTAANDLMNKNFLWIAINVC